MDFVFNAAGQRASIWNGNTRTVVQGQYYWGGQPVAFYKGGSLHFQHQDWMGTEHMRTTYSGASEGQFTSLPFGDGLTTTSGTDTDAYHFATVDHDYETDTEHAQFRQYSSAQGRFLSPDPYGGSYDPSNPQSFNRYAYVMNNPLSAVDPSGLDLTWSCTETETPIDTDDGSGVNSTTSCSFYDDGLNPPAQPYIPSVPIMRLTNLPSSAPSTGMQIKAGAIAAKVIAYNLFVPTCQSLANSSTTLGRISGATGAYAVGSAALAAETGGTTLPGAAVLGTVSAATGLVSFADDLAATFQIGCR